MQFPCHLLFRSSSHQNVFHALPPHIMGILLLQTPPNCCQFLNSQSKPNYSAAFLQSTTDLVSLVFAELICVWHCIYISSCMIFTLTLYIVFSSYTFCTSSFYHLTLCKYFTKKWYKRKYCCALTYIQRIAKYSYMHHLVRRKTTCSRINWRDVQ